MKKELKFKTNIKCMGCVAKVTPTLDEAVGRDNWEVNLQSADRQLTVNVEEVDAETVIAAVSEAGFKAEVV